eukprot:1085649-Prorocentrum_minimum.AAC.3
MLEQLSLKLIVTVEQMKEELANDTNASVSTDTETLASVGSTPSEPKVSTERERVASVEELKEKVRSLWVPVMDKSPQEDKVEERTGPRDPVEERKERIRRELPFVTSFDLVAEGVKFHSMAVDLKGQGSYVANMLEWKERVPQELQFHK